MKPRKLRPTPPPPPMQVDEDGNHQHHEMPPMEEDDMPAMMMSSSMIDLDTPRYLGAHALAQQLQLEVSEEGFVLLKNNGVLPLSGPVKLNVFGSQAKNVFSPDTCAKYGVELNDELYTYYKKYKNRDAVYTGSGYDEEKGQYVPQHRTSGGMFGGGSTYLRQEPYIGYDVFNEDGSVRVAQIPQELLDRAKAYSDVAVVVLHREAGEGADHEKGDETLSEGEAAMLSFCSGNFAKVIVVMATNDFIDGDFLAMDTVQKYYKYTYGGDVYSNNIGMEKLADFDSRVELIYAAPHTYPITADGLGACIYTCDSLGDRGGEALLKILLGQTNPSGRLTDEIVYDYDDNPVSLSYGALVFNNETTKGDKYIYGHNYVAYKEGVYLGYKYFETFASDRVVYPFGYGLSYTSFDWKCGRLITDYNEYNELRFGLEVTVTNTGAVAGKDVVEMYVTAPYYENSKYHLEKPLVSLAAYAKTDLLQPGQSQTVKLVWNARDIACYSDTFQCYVLEAGEYLFNVATNARTAHTAPAEVIPWVLDNKTAALTSSGAHVVRVDNDVRFLADEVTGTAYRNLFTGSDEAGWTFDAHGTEKENIVYIHRVDLDGVPYVAPGTYPQNNVIDEHTRETTQILDLETRGLESCYEMDATARYFYDDDIPVPTTNAVYHDKDGRQKNFMLQDVNRLIKKTEAPEYHNVEALKALTGIQVEKWTDETDDMVWDYFLDQLSVNEMMCRFYHCGFDIPALLEYGIPRTYSADGPGRIGANNKEKMGATTNYRDLLLACTWNTDLLYRFGLALGREAAASEENGTSWFYAPGSNIHRSCLSGKNNNYWSEDAWLAGTSCGYFLKGLEEGGVNGCLKHFATNDQEMSREGLVVFSNEQALRETYFAAFEHAIKIGNGQGIMTSLGRVGTVNACGNTHLTVDLLRNEWGFDGMVITDGYGVTSYMYNINCMIGGSSGLLCFGTSGNFGECRDFMELYRYYLAYPGRTVTALRKFMKGALNGLLYSHTFVDFYQDYDYYASDDADYTTDINWFDAEIGLGYEYYQADKLTYKGIKLMEGESNPPGMMPNKNCKDRGGTIVADDYGLKQMELTASAGGTVTVPVSMQKSYGMAEMGMSILWDASALEFVGIQPCIDGYSCTVQPVEGGVNVVLKAEGKSLNGPCGKLFDLTLTVKPGTKAGAYELRLVPVLDDQGQPTGSFFDKQGHEMSVTLVSQKSKYDQSVGGWAGVYQNVFDASWWETETMDKVRQEELADLTLLSGSVTVE